MLTVNAGFKMHMLRSSTAGTSGQSDRLSGFHRISALYQILEVMTVNRFQPVRMTDYNQISVSIIWLRHTYDSIKSSTNRIFGTRLYICSRMSSASSVSGNNFGSGKGKSIFMLFCKKYPNAVYMITFRKKSGE